MLELDGSTGEGGGQIVRTSLFLSLLLQRPVRVTRIRAGRAKAGLKPQHVAILRLLSEMTGSACDGAAPGSPEVAFRPGSFRPGSWTLDVGTAGAITLVLQTALPVALATPGRTTLEVTGGTDVPFAPTVDWLREAYLPYVAPLREVRLEVLRRGFAPHGGGRVRLTVEGPAPEPGLDGMRAAVRENLGRPRVRQGKLVALGGRSIAHASLPRGVAARQALAAQANLLGVGPTPAVAVEEVEADGPGSAVTLWFEDDGGNRLAADRLGHPKARAEDVGRIAAVGLLEDWRAGGTVDRHLADHVVPWVALGAGAVRVPHATPHLETNAWVCNRFLGEWTVRTDRGIVR